ncbi:MAG: rhomboid family intramembrane serine protease [Prevotella sp.]|nr:rhomboid family intramembrane serine protease [Candidatus Prevotella equi]
MRQIPTITKNLLIINVLCFLACVVFEGRGIDLNNIFGLHYFQATDFRLYQVITYMFMHGGFTHLFFNMFALWMFGGVIERTFGEKRYLIYYIVCGLGAALCQELSQFLHFYSVIADQGATIGDMLNLDYGNRMALNVFTTVGASGSIYGILLAFGMSYPEERMFIFPLPFPIKAKWFVIGYAAIELFLASSQRGDGVAHIAHLGGMLFGYIMIKMWRRTSSSFNGWDGYEIKESKAKTILGKIRRWLHLDGRDKDNDDLKYGKYNKSYKNSNDWDYNAQQKKKEADIDKILDKIRRSGYESLTEEEKKRLFEQKK